MYTKPILPYSYETLVMPPRKTFR